MFEPKNLDSDQLRDMIAEYIADDDPDLAVALALLRIGDELAENNRLKGYLGG